MGKLFYSYRDGEVYRIMFDMDKDVNEFFEYVSTVTGKKC